MGEELCLFEKEMLMRILNLGDRKSQNAGADCMMRKYVCITCNVHQVVTVIKVRKMRWPGHVACMGAIKAYAYKIGKEETPWDIQAWNRVRSTGLMAISMNLKVMW
jgi:hypothetical protein